MNFKFLGGAGIVLVWEALEEEVLTLEVEVVMINPTKCIIKNYCKMIKDDKKLT